LNLQVGDANETLLGYIDAGGMVFNSEETMIGQIDTDDNKILRDGDGNTVAEVNSSGEIKGNAQTNLGRLDPFSYENMNTLALYLLLLDPDMLKE